MIGNKASVNRMGFIKSRQDHNDATIVTSAFVTVLVVQRVAVVVAKDA